MPEVRNTYGDRGLDRELDLMRAELRQLRAQLRAQAAAPAGQASATAGQAQVGPSSTFGRAAAAPTPPAAHRSPVVLPATGVTSIFTRSGDVVAQAGDYLASQVTNALDESTGGTVLGPVTVSALLWALAGLGTKYAKVGGCLQSTDHFPDIGSSGTTESGNVNTLGGQAAGMCRIQGNGAGYVYFPDGISFTSASDANSDTATLNSTSYAGFAFIEANAGNTPLRIKMAASQTADAFFLWDSSSNLKMRLLPSGQVYTVADLLSDDSGHGLVLKSPNGHYWRVKVDNAGALSTTDLGTTAPS